MNYGGSDTSVSQTDFLKQVDEVARIMCAEMGCDPHLSVPVPGPDADMIAGIEFKPVALKEIHNPGVAPPYFVARTPYGWQYSGGFTGTTSEQPFIMPLWRTMRPAAAQAIAGWRAVHKWALVGKTS